MAEEQTVLVFGATGNTGASIINGLVDSGQFKVIAAIRPAPKDKPEVILLKSRRVEIRLADLNAIDDTISEVFRGVDVVISAAEWKTLPAQKQLIDAANHAGVKRFIPNDWATPCVRGVRKLDDEKAVIHDYVKEVGIGYTFVDVGMWIQVAFAPAEKSQEKYPGQFDLWRTIIGKGNVKSAFTDIADIGVFVARIIADPRTLNQYVFCWGDEATKQEIFNIAEKFSGDKFEPIRMTIEEKEKIVEQSRAEGGVMEALHEYEYSYWVRGDNTIENAKKPEYGNALDARELYPDIKPHSLEDYARQFYRQAN
ncbi:NAD-binding protein [Rickenella mellea]|uniref:NAD-binding protein n=1 Tax=Rickenella mellea TaxID=50990 RepID=A0A4Y7PF88_9AGAM|nr:NAD-binding protein [Rickenella mellea]